MNLYIFVLNIIPTKLDILQKYMFINYLPRKLMKSFIGNFVAELGLQNYDAWGDIIFFYAIMNIGISDDNFIHQWKTNEDLISYIHFYGK